VDAASPVLEPRLRGGTARPEGEPTMGRLEAVYSKIIFFNVSFCIAGTYAVILAMWR
jgi:hypothetical protein